MVHNRGIEANLEKVQGLLDMKSLVKVRNVQRLIGCVAALNRFVAQATDQCLPFFKALNKGFKFVWMDECECECQELKFYLGNAPLLSKTIDGETLSLYLAMLKAAVNVVLYRI